MFPKPLLCLIFVTVYAYNFEHNTTISYDPGELLSKIFSGNQTHSRNSNGQIKFEQNRPDFISFDDQIADPSNKGPVKFEEEKKHDIGDTSIRFDDNQSIRENGFNDPIGILQSGININEEIDFGLKMENNPNAIQKTKRRRRKPKNQVPHPSFINPGYPGPIGLRPGPIHDFRPNYVQPGYIGQFQRPVRRPRPSLATEALVAVTGALTSIAQNDDYQCVARLLCEAAAGGALGGSSLLDSVSGLQPLLTLLSAYNGISSNPLFVFGRAAFLGMSSKENPGSCRYAYPQCPTDPEQLVHYLNNHNGGFFRFFNSPQRGQQNLEQFYNQLSQNYGLYQPGSHQEAGQYGLLNPVQPVVGQQPNLYPNGYGYQQNYGLAFPYNQNYNSIRFKNDKDTVLNYDDNKIQKRILHKPLSQLNDITSEYNSKWLFPGEDDDSEESIGVKYVNFDFQNDNRISKTLRFPDVNTDRYNSLEIRKPSNVYTSNSYNDETNRKPKGFLFPDNHSNNYDDSTKKYYSNYPVYSNDNFVVKNIRSVVNNNYSDNKDEPGVTTVYVVRGNGDPRKPEVVKLRPGETL